jgi:hypothetical protein
MLFAMFSYTSEAFEEDRTYMTEMILDGIYIY